jgi:hypothetical protein
MNNKIRILISGIAGTVAVYIVSFVFWGTRLSAFVTSNAGEAGEKALQQALAATLPNTGRYYVPTPGGPGAALYNHGPIAVIDYNSAGYPTPDADLPAAITGLLMNWVVVMVIGLTLAIIASRVTDFKSRAGLVIGISTASAVLIVFAHVIFSHVDWHFAVYNLIANISIICAGGLVMARWSLPRAIA